MQERKKKLGASQAPNVSYASWTERIWFLLKGKKKKSIHYIFEMMLLNQKGS